MYSQEERKYILQLARQAIKNYLDFGLELEIDEAEIVGEDLKQKRACFVTLTIIGELRGCIGHLEATQPFYLDVIGNAVGAAFNDSRFLPLSREELENIEIEISVLSAPEVLEYKDGADLLRLLRPGVDGVIIEKGTRGATYLPQVWEEISRPEEFLSSLCRKAGLPEDEWERGELKVSTYTIEVIK